MGWFVSGKKTMNNAVEYPTVVIKERLKKVEIRGCSRMTNPNEFYEELLQTIDTSFHLFDNTLFIDIYFEYINTASSKWLLNMLSSFESIVEHKGVVEINWFYEEDDETIRDTGVIFKSRLNFPFYLHEI